MKRFSIFLIVLNCILFSSCSDSGEFEYSNKNEETPLDLDETQPISFYSGIEPVVSTKGTGVIGGEETESLWNGQKIRIFAVNKYRIPESLVMGYEAPLGNGVEVIMQDDNSQIIELAKPDGTPYYYPRTGLFNFFAYYSDDAVSENLRSGIYDAENNAYYVPFTIDGSQDLMFAKGALNSKDDKVISNDERQYLFGAHSSRMGWRPNLKFEHLLTRFTFDIAWGDDVRHNAGSEDTRTSHEVYIKSISIKSRKTGKMYIIKSDEMPNLVWDSSDNDENSGNEIPMYLKRVDVKGEKLVNLDYGTGFDVTGINPENYPNKTDLIEKISQEGFTLEQVLGNYHLDEEDTKKIVRVGDCLLIESGKEEYVMEMVVRQYYDRNGKYVDKSIGEHKYTISIREDEKGKPIVFKPGYTYNILLKIYGIENIEVSTEVSDWQNGGGSIGWDPDEF